MSRITSNVVEVKKQNHMIASVGSNGQKVMHMPYEKMRMA